MIATLILDDIVILKKKTGFAVLLWVVVIIVRASLTVRITVKNGNLPEDHKIWEIRFFTVKGLINRKKTKSLGTYAQVSFGVLKFVHYWGRRDNFDKGDRSKNKKGPKVH